MPRTSSRGRRFSWRRPAAGAAPHFEVLVSSRWTAAVAAITGLAALALGRLPRARRAPALGGLLFGMLFGGLLLLLEGVRGAAFAVFRRVDLPIDQLPPALEGFTIAQLSDLHLGVPLTYRAIRRAVAAVESARPDLIVLTGDYITYDRHLPLLRAALAPLAAPHGILAIFGNHDHWTDLPAITRLLQDLGIEVLVNRHRTLAVGDAQLVIAGVDDIWDGAPDLDAALAGAPAGAPVILLAHSPDFADEAARSCAAVQLAGHTHAGHIRLPGLGALFLPRHGIRYDRGLWRVGNMWLYVSQGLGGWPIRIGCRPEATLFTLRRGDREQGTGDRG
jgi:predicted MPP superfamily phosphohydrolase